MPIEFPTVTQADTISALLDRSKRSEVPIRKTFVQQGSGKVRDPGPLAFLCGHHDERALDAYLLLHAAASGAPFDVVLPSAVWARALGLSSASPSSRSAVSKTFARLEVHGLIHRERAGNRSKLVLLDEGGQGADYVHPAAHKEPYLKLGHEYWRDDWHLKLNFRAKVVLLIAHSLDDGFILPIERAKDWYGISADTVQRGLAELEQHGLLDIDVQYKPAPLAPEGYTQDRRFTLRAPFGPLRKPLATVTKLQVG